MTHIFQKWQKWRMSSEDHVFLSHQNEICTDYFFILWYMLHFANTMTTARKWFLIPGTSIVCCKKLSSFPYSGSVSLKLHSTVHQYLHYCLKIIIHEDHICCLFTNICSGLSHCYTNICSLQSNSIIHSISCHSYYCTIILQGLKKGKKHKSEIEIAYPI